MTIRRLRPRVHKLDLMASKPGAVPLCQHTGGTSQTPEQGGGCYYYYVLCNLVFRPKKKRFSVVRRPTAQQSPYPRLLSTTMWTLLLLRSLPLNNPFSMWLRQLWPQRGRGWGGEGPTVQTFTSRLLGVFLCLLGSQSCGWSQRICSSLAVLLL